MYWIFVETDFEASHRLTFADGTQEHLHSHRWHVMAAVGAASLNAQGLVMDFLELKQLLDEVVEPLSGQELETLPWFSETNASAEAVARSLFGALAGRIRPPARLGYIEVAEAPGCRARFELDA